MDIAAEILTYHGWQPTPSAQAMESFWETYPWAHSMFEIDGLRAYTHPAFSGLMDCRKCNWCIVARMHDIRKTYDPDICAAMEDDSI